jgi:fluoroacetyl-CoA thioesterase
MKSSLMPGISAVHRVEVEQAKTVGFMGEECRVFATTHLIADIETTCRNLILAHADDNEDNVGIEVAVEHFAPALAGTGIEIAVEITAIEGRKVTFAVIAKDEFDTLSRGTHTRFIVEKAKTVERLKAKAAKLAARQG